MGIRKGLSAVFAVAVLATGGYALANSELPASAGITYLDQHGYKDVTPTGNPFYTGCARNLKPRSYMATSDKTGQRQKETLCFGSLHSIYRP